VSANSFPWTLTWALTQHNWIFQSIFPISVNFLLISSMRNVWMLLFQASPVSFGYLCKWWPSCLLFVCMYVYMYVCMCMYFFMYLLACSITYVYVCMYECMYVCTYVFVFVCMYARMYFFFILLLSMLHYFGVILHAVNLHVSFLCRGCSDQHHGVRHCVPFKILNNTSI
jgi:hypothetical protein